MTDPLPRPTISSESVSRPDGVRETIVTASRDGKSRSWKVEGHGEADVARKVAQKILDDHHSAEYVRRG